MVILLILKLKSVSIWKAKGRTIKRSVISSLAHLFNFLIAITLGAPVLGSPNGVFDQAIFRLSGQAYFLSDLKKTQKALNSLKCVKDQGLLTRYLGVDLTVLASMPLVSEKEDRVTAKEGELFPFIYLEKIKNSALGRGKETVTKQEFLNLGSGCRKISWEKLSIDEKALFLTEVYLRDRFTGADNLEAALSEFKKGLDVKDTHEFFSLNPSGQLLKAVKEAAKEELEKVPEVEETTKGLLAPPENSSESSEGAGALSTP